jgi:beta-lactam-binding protein with PASTA domain
MPDALRLPVASKDNIPRFRDLNGRRLADSSGFKRKLRCPRGLVARHVLLSLAVAAGSLSTTSCQKKSVVPQLANQDLSLAEQALTAAALKVGTVSGLPSGGSTAGAYVSAQNPAAGQQVPANSTVDLVVVPPVLVPDLTNGNVTDAVNTLQGIGLKVAFVKQPTANIFSRGGVKQQTPAANTLVRQDSVVTLTVEAPPNVGALLGMATKDPAYQKLNPEYRNVLDQFLNVPPNANTTASGAPPKKRPSSH